VRDKQGKKNLQKISVTTLWCLLMDQQLRLITDDRDKSSLGRIDAYLTFLLDAFFKRGGR
jgi:hypothetical protein